MSSSSKPPIILCNSDWNSVPQWGLLAQTCDAKAVRVGIDVNTTTCAIATGTQGAGKSYALKSILENYVMPIRGANELVVPGCALVFHQSQSQDYKPELTRMGEPNGNKRELEALAEWGITPTGAKEIVVLTPPKLVERRRAEFPTLQVEPLLINEQEASVESWLNLLGDASSSSPEIEVLLETMEDLRENLSMGALVERIVNNPLLEDAQKKFLQLKLKKATKFMTTGEGIMRHFRPGRVIIADLRDEFLSQTQAFRLLLVLLDVFQNARMDGGRLFPKILVADEAHEYANDAYLVRNFVRMVRLMRHKALTILIGSQDPMSIHATIKELSSLTIMLNSESDGWVKDMAAAKAPIGRVPTEFFCGLEPGECWIWSRFASHPEFTAKPQRCRIRPGASMHGGFTKVAVSG